MTKTLPALDYQGNIAVLSLSSDNSVLPILSQAVTDELSRLITDLEMNTALQGLVIIGTPRGFCGGAEIDSIKSVTDRELGTSLAKKGQDIFNRIEALKFPTLAFIHGACFGGALELALACKYRVVTDSDSTKLGLPEVKIGIIPGFGGTQRLPRIISLAAALGMILTGRGVSAKEAARTGLANELVNSVRSEEDLLESAISALKRLELVAKPRSKGADYLAIAAKTPLIGSIVHARFRKQVLNETKGFYPAPLKALEVVFSTLGMHLTDGLRVEAQALGEMIITPECKALINLYDATAAASKLGKASGSTIRDWLMGVVGGGVMGSGVASLLVSKGFKVKLFDVDPATVAKAKERVKIYLERRKGLSSGLKAEYYANLTVGSKLSELSDCGAVIEAVFEDVEVKKKLLADLSAILPEESLILSNTSSLKLETMVGAVKNPARFLGMHFFNPPEKMPLVEIIRTKSTGERELLSTSAIAVALGKNPVIVEDVQGFLVNRVLTFYLAQAFRLLQSGVPFNSVERAALDFGLPMGPFRLMDEVGLDVVTKASASMISAYQSRLNFSTEEVELLVGEGIKGRKSGSGFYVYNGKSESPNDAVINRFVADGTVQVPDRDLQKLLIYPMLNEALVCLTEGVAGNPSAEAIWQIDLGSVMGFGFPPFRGGMLFYLNHKGQRLVAEESKSLCSRYPFAAFECAALG